MDARIALVAFALVLPVCCSLACIGNGLPLDGDPSAVGGEGADAPVRTTVATSTVTGHLLVNEATGKAVAAQKNSLHPPVPDAEPADLVNGELVVMFDEATGEKDRQRILAEHGLQVIEHSPSGLWRVACPPRSPSNPADARTDTLGDAQRLRARQGVRFASVNQRRQPARVPDDPDLYLQWHYPAINLPEAWDLTTGSDDVIVAVVDTGILSGHPDLAGRLVSGYDFVADPLAARDGDGRDPDPEDPGDELNGPGYSSFHGTHVAGTIGAATNNHLGIAGVTWQGKIMPVRALGKGGGTSFDVAEAIRFAAGLPNVSGTVPEKPARIINLSVAGMPGDPPSAEESAAITAATNAGVLVVGAAGNQGSAFAAYPAAQDEVLSVGAVDVLGELASYSNFGPTVDLVAPGGQTGVDVNADGYADGVLSTCATDLTGAIKFNYLYARGTSMATPHVAGVAALVMAANPALNAAQVRAVLESTARDLGSAGRDPQYGNGLLDASAAVREAYRLAGQSANTSPLLTLSTTLLDFGDDRREFHARVANAGIGYLTVSAVTVQTTDGGNWLQAETAGTAENANVQDVVIRVTRAGLADGTYHGLVTVDADGQAPATVDVSMTVAPVARPGEVVYVVALDPSTRLVVAQAQTTPEGSFGYHLGELPPGDYLIYAGTDRNGDGYIGDAGDLCGALPSLDAPAPLTVLAGDWLLDVDFPIAELWSDDGEVTPLHIPLMP